MTPTLKYWCEQATQLGLDECHQRGLLFLLALDISVIEDGADREAVVEGAKKFSSHISSAKLEYIADFNDGRIADVLADFAYFFDPHFSPRAVYTARDGKKAYAFEKPGSSAFAQMSAGADRIDAAEDLYSSLCKRIGDQIEGDPEGAFLAGLAFFASYLTTDATSTLKIARMVMAAPPPDLQFLHSISRRDLEDLTSWPLASHVLGCFVGDASGKPEVLLESLYALCTHLQGPDSAKLWDSPLPVFAGSLSLTPLLSWSGAEPAWAQETRSFLLKDFEPPPRAKTSREACNAVAQLALSRWGLNLFSDVPMPYGQELNRRVCALFICTVFSILRPGWNDR